MSEPATLETPPATDQPPSNPPVTESNPNDHASFLKRLQGESTDAPASNPDPEPPAPPVEPAKPQVSDDPFDLGSKKPLPTDATQTPPATTPPATTPTDGEEPLPKTAEDWKAFKSKATERARAERDAELRALEQERNELRESRQELESKLERYSLVDTPGFREKYSKPKQEALNAIKSVAGETPEIKTLLAHAEAGTLNPSNIPDIKGLNDFQKSILWPEVNRLYRLQQEEKVALENWQETRERLRIDEFKMEQARVEGDIKNLSVMLQSKTQIAIGEAKSRLQGFSDSDIQYIHKNMGGPDPIGFMISSTVALSTAKRLLVDVQAEKDRLEAESKAKDAELAQLREHVNGTNQIDRITQGGEPTASTTNSSEADALSHAALMARLRSLGG